MLRKLEKYELLEEIGHGGMATVYRARDERLDREVAVKVLHPHLQKAREARVRFTREAQSVAKLKHDHILEIYDYSGEDSEESFIAAELLTGPTLRRFVEDGPEIPAEVAACFSIQIASALASAHQRGIVHRDVKPENVLLHEQRIVKLTDFGIAQMLDAQSFTATGQILGSPGHMAPEQVETGVVDERSDVFSLGTVIYFLAVGRLPFTGKNPHQVLKRIMDAEYPHPLRVKPSVGSELSAAIVRCMERDPKDRFQSVSDVEAALRSFVGGMGIDDPDALLVRYLADPEDVAAELRTQSIDALLARGKAALQKKQRSAALDAFNRVLALDEGNAQVLKLVDSLGTGDPKILWAGVIAVVLGVAALTYALWPSDGTDPVVADAGIGVLEDSGADAPELADAAPDAPVQDARAEDAPTRVDAGPTRRDTGRPTVRAGPRMVQFSPSPQNVMIRVDDAPPRAFGPTFFEVELQSGSTHTFEFRPTDDCCEVLRITRRIPPGNGPYSLSARLPYRAARLYIVARPGNVVVRPGRGAGARGRTRDFIIIPMGAAVDERTFEVTAEGYQVYTSPRPVQLRAGEVTSVTVDLTSE